jgi:CP12 domain
MHSLPIICCTKPPRRIQPKHLKLAIQYARNVCYESKDVPACRVAWDRVEEVSAAMYREREAERERDDEMCIIDPIACREYDV